VKVAVCLAFLATPALWADETADRVSIDATVAALATSPFPAKLYAAHFPNGPELQRLLWEGVASSTLPDRPLIPMEDGVTINTQAGTLIISHEPMGEATWHPALTPPAAPAPHFITRSVRFNFRRNAAVVVATYVHFTSGNFRMITERNTEVQFGLKRERSDWRIASFRVLPVAPTKATR
jgi:hypothetical protein